MLYLLLTNTKVSPTTSNLTLHFIVQTFKIPSLKRHKAWAGTIYYLHWPTLQTSFPNEFHCATKACLRSQLKWHTASATLQQQDKIYTFGPKGHLFVFSATIKLLLQSKL